MLLAVAAVVPGLARLVPVTGAAAAQTLTLTATDDLDDGACTRFNRAQREAINAANANDTGSIDDDLQLGIDGNIVRKFTPTTT